MALQKRPRFIYIDKQGRLVWEIPTFGKFRIFDTGRVAVTGNIKAVFVRNGKEYTAGEAHYSNFSAGRYINPVAVKDPYKRLNLATLMIAYAEANSQGKLLSIQQIKNHNVIKIAEKLGHTIGNPRGWPEFLSGEPSFSQRKVRDAEEWKLKATPELRARRRIARK